jgi:hypothetical protein
VRRVASGAFPVLALLLASGPAGVADPPTLGERAAVIERVSTEPDGTRVLGHLSRTLQAPTDELRTQREQTGRAEDRAPAVTAGGGAGRRGSTASVRGRRRSRDGADAALRTARGGPGFSIW